MKRTNNLNVRSMTPIIAPTDLKQVFPRRSGPQNSLPARNNGSRISFTTATGA
ncbi:MAG: hypothetical protein R2864_10495 [Syntrophotaleaceae bacterium]